MEKNKKIVGILIGVIAIFVMTLFLFSFLSKNKTETEKSNIMQSHDNVWSSKNQLKMNTKKNNREKKI